MPPFRASLNALTSCQRPPRPSSEQPRSCAILCSCVPPPCALRPLVHCGHSSFSPLCRDLSALPSRPTSRACASPSSLWRASGEVGEFWPSWAALARTAIKLHTLRSGALTSCVRCGAMAGPQPLSAIAQSSIGQRCPHMHICCVLGARLRTTGNPGVTGIAASHASVSAPLSGALEPWCMTSVRPAGPAQRASARGRRRQTSGARSEHARQLAGSQAAGTLAHAQCACLSTLLFSSLVARSLSALPASHLCLLAKAKAAFSSQENTHAPA